MRRTAVLSAAVAVGLAGSSLATPTALAQNPTTSPFTPGIPQNQATVSTTTTPAPTVSTATSSSSGGSGLSGSSAVVIGIGALALIAAISLFIWRDARRRAPVRHRAAATSGEGGRPGSKSRQKPRKLSPAERRRRKRGRAR